MKDDLHIVFANFNVVIQAYLEKRLREAWIKEQQNLRQKAIDKRNMAERTAQRRRRQREEEEKKREED